MSIESSVGTGSASTSTGSFSSESFASFTPTAPVSSDIAMPSMNAFRDTAPLYSAPGSLGSTNFMNDVSISPIEVGDIATPPRYFPSLPRWVPEMPAINVPSQIAPEVSISSVPELGGEITAVPERFDDTTLPFVAPSIRDTSPSIRDTYVAAQSEAAQNTEHALVAAGIDTEFARSLVTRIVTEAADNEPLISTVNAEEKDEEITESALLEVNSVAAVSIGELGEEQESVPAETQFPLELISPLEQEEEWVDPNTDTDESNEEEEELAREPVAPIAMIHDDETNATRLETVLAAWIPGGTGDELVEQLPTALEAPTALTSEVLVSPDGSVIKPDGSYHDLREQVSTIEKAPDNDHTARRLFGTLVLKNTAVRTGTLFDGTVATSQEIHRVFKPVQTVVGLL